jgi:hypothetical protein
VVPSRLRNFARAVAFLLYSVERYRYGLLVMRWSLVGPDSSPLFLPAVYFSAKS